MDGAERVAALLRQRGAERIEHPGGTLYDHLERVQQRLARVGCPQHVQLAGRAHAVYGTDGFDVRLLTDDERTVLAGLIGVRAEQLVHRYGACDRDRTWSTLATDRTVRYRQGDPDESLDDDDLRDFADLSLVNEIDVADHAPGFLQQHGAWFRRLADDWAPILSPAVAAEARRILG